MTEVEKIMSETKEIAENIKANYTLEKTALQFGYKILIEKENRNCITLCDDFYYFDESVKEAEEKIDRGCEKSIVPKKRRTKGLL